jgi:hypothetical protein
MKYVRAFCQSWYWGVDLKSPGAKVKMRLRQINCTGAGNPAIHDSI